jgi:hypothetical protein
MPIQVRRTVLLFVGLIVLGNTVAAVAATYHVAEQHPRASDENAGTADAPFKTISRAVIAAVEGGDTVIVDTGVYREHVAPTRGGTGPDALITYMAKPGARVTIKGSQVWQPAWRKTLVAAAVVWQAALEPALFADSRALYEPADEPFNPFVVGNAYSAAVSTTRNVLVRPAKDGEPCQLTRGQIFVNGRPLWQVNRLEDLQQQLDTFFVARDGKRVSVRLLGDLAPEDSFVEITVREQVFAPLERNLPYIRVAGFTIEHAANGRPFPQVGALSTRVGRNWIIEDNVIRYANTVGLDIGQESWAALNGRQSPQVWQGSLRLNMPHGPWSGVEGHIIRRNIITDNGQAGIVAYGAGPRLLIEHNRIERNNRLHFAVDSESGGFKGHGVRNSIFRANLFRDNDCNGLWLDSDCDNNRITRSLFVNNVGSGVFLEACGRGGQFKGKIWNLVDNNIAANTRPAVGGFYGDGFYVHSGGQAVFCHNLSFGNAFYGIRIQYLDGRHPTDGHHIFNNIIFANGRGAIHIPPSSKDNFCDYNVFGPTRARTQPNFGGGLGQSPGGRAPLMSLDGWRKTYNWDTHSKYEPQMRGQLWARSAELNLWFGPLNKLGFPGIPPFEMTNPYQSPPLIEGAEARDAWTERGIDVDYSGNARPKTGAPTPGPFQFTADQQSVGMRLWPIR